jgi:cellulose synthase/poly-beta-1,6-N-acetylglucosamine synthase-like glycosyltransferase
MEAVITCLAAITAIYLLITLIEVQFGLRSIPYLGHQSIMDSKQLPAVSIIFSALNEEAAIADAVNSLMKIDYPNLEVIAINDRSTDRTGEILASLQLQYPNLKVLNIDTLPAGWLGKNHALYQGSQMAAGEWLLFTDADVIMQPDTLKRAMSYCMEHQTKHLTIAEKHVRNTFPLQILLFSQYLSVCMMLKPWRVRYRWSKRSLGFGVFNLVQKSAYAASGGHQAIAFECLDDLKLGALIKAHGFKQDTVNGGDFIERQWYATLPEMIEGWKKNSFAFFEYRASWVVGGTILMLLLFLLPLLSIPFSHGYLFYLNVMNVCLTLQIAMIICMYYRIPIWFSLYYLPSILLMLYSIWNSMFTIYRQGGVVWRGTHYSLELLRKAA